MSRSIDIKMLTLLVAVLALAASNLALLFLLDKCSQHSHVTPSSPVSGPSPQSTPPATRQPNTSNPQQPSQVSNASTSLEIPSSPQGPAWNTTPTYTYYPVPYYLEIEAVGGPYPGAPPPEIPSDLKVEVVYLEGIRSSNICPVTMKTKLDEGAAYLNVTLPLPGGKCFKVTPLLVNRTKTSVYYRLALQEDPGGACGYCVAFTLKVSFLPPGRYTVTVGPELKFEGGQG